MRQVKMYVGNKPIGKAQTWAYPDGDHLGNFTIPTYRLTVSGKDNANRKVERHFEVIRFGIQFKAAIGRLQVVGLAERQTHVIKAWLPFYRVHSANSTETGAWKVYDNFLIHDGPDDPKDPASYASIGCIEICNGPRGFDKFNDLLIALSGPLTRTRAEQLLEIGRSRNMSITYLKAARPPLTPSP
jgi:hypothetical protein